MNLVRVFPQLEDHGNAACVKVPRKPSTTCHITIMVFRLVWFLVPRHSIITYCHQFLVISIT
jgi:hypothetical protein